MKNKIGKVMIIWGLIISAFCTILYLIFSARNLTVSYYKINREVIESFRIVQLTDLHNAIFGESNKALISLVAKQKPDIIVMTGDMLNEYDPNTEIITDLIVAMTSVAPVYYGYGNNEKTWEETYKKKLDTVFEEAGAIVVDNNYVDVEINGVTVRIGGYMGYYRQPHMLTLEKEQKQLELEFCSDFENTNRFKILLNHIPTAWVDWEYIDKFEVDLVFSGHYHGGQWVMPFIGPLYAPYIGFDPPYVKGKYEGKKATCILSAGLGSGYWWLPRINNPPEIVVLDVAG